MECVDTGSFIFSLVWSFVMVAFVVKMDRLNGFDSGLKDIFSTPIISALIISVAYVYFFYEAPTPPGQQSLGGIVQRWTNFIEYSVCSFVSVLNVWGIILILVGVYKFFIKHMPNEVQNFKDKVRSWFGS